MDTPTKFKESKGATTLLLFSILILLPDLLPSRRTLYFSRFSLRKSTTLPENNLKVIWFFVRIRASDRVRQKMGNSAARKVYYAANYAIFLKLI